MNITDARENLTKKMPDWVPQPVKNKPLATVTTLISTFAGVIAIAAWLGFRPPQVLADDQAYVTHQQFNLLMVKLVESVEELEDSVERLQKRPIVTTRSRSAGVSDTPPAPAVVFESAIEDNEPTIEVLKGRLKGAYDQVQHMQLEQRTK